MTPRVRSWVDVPVRLGSGTRVSGRFFSFEGLADREEHVVVAVGPYLCPRDGVPLVRLHSECLTGDVFGSGRCDCGPQLAESVETVADRGGYVVYLRQEGRGIGLYAKLDAYRLQDAGLDTFEANRALGYAEDGRDYQVASQMLLALGVSELDLLSGNPDKARGLERGGVKVRRRLPTRLHRSDQNVRYLDAKRACGFQFADDPGSLRAVPSRS